MNRTLLYPNSIPNRMNTSFCVICHAYMLTYLLPSDKHIYIYIHVTYLYVPCIQFTLNENWIRNVFGFEQFCLLRRLEKIKYIYHFEIIYYLVSRWFVDHNPLGFHFWVRPDGWFVLWVPSLLFIPTFDVGKCNLLKGCAVRTQKHSLTHGIFVSSR